MAHLWPGTVVTVTGFEAAPFSNFYWKTPVCSRNICTVVMDQDWLLEGEVYDSSPDDQLVMTAYAGPDQRVPSGTPTTLWVSLYNPSISAILLPVGGRHHRNPPG